MLKVCDFCKKEYKAKKKQKFCSVNCRAKGTPLYRKKFINSGQFKKGQKPWNFGLIGFGKEFGFQKGHGYIGGGSKKGIRVSPQTEFKKGITPWNKGKIGVMPEAWNKGMGNNSRTERQKESGTPEYKMWRESVFKRDDYTCVKCGERGGKLQADHIKMWSLYPEGRFDIDNGQTLCKPCHVEKTRAELKVYWVNQFTMSNNLNIIL